MRNQRVLTIWGLVAAVGCASPTRPTTSVVAGHPVTGEMTISYYEQPVTLTIASGLTTSDGRVDDVVELAQDAQFTRVLAARPAASDGNGRETASFDALQPDTTYFWRARSAATGEVSVVSPASRLTVGPRLILESPTPIQPLADTYPRKRPTFVIRNAAHTGPPAALSYVFEVSEDVGFATSVTSGTVTEGSGQTAFVPAVDLRPGATYFWRARAIDARLGESGTYSTATSFKVVFPDDGSYPYRLVLRTPAWCVTHSVRPPTDFVYSTHQVSWYALDFGRNGNLYVENDSLRFHFSEAWTAYPGYPRGDLQLGRSGSRVAGDVFAGDANGTWLLMRGRAVGASDNHGRFDGSLVGDVTLVWEGIPGVGAARCSAEFQWTLLPR